MIIKGGTRISVLSTSLYYLYLSVSICMFPGIQSLPDKEQPAAQQGETARTLGRGRHCSVAFAQSQS